MADNLTPEEKSLENQADTLDLNEAESTTTADDFESPSEYKTEANEENKPDIDTPNTKAENDVPSMQATDSVVDAITALSEKIDSMNQLFVQKIQHTTHEEKIVDQMHAELQRYKEDMYAQLVRPILLDIIEIRDSIIRMSASFATKPEGEQNVPLKTFRDYSYDIQDVLEKNNITIYNSEECDVFNPVKQRVIKKVTTPVEELHGKIAESLSSGYDYMGKTISPEKVAVYIYQKSNNIEGENKNG